jgi:hypothetical protein
MQTANLINFIGALEKVEATPELIAKNHNSIQSYDRNGKEITIEF